MKTIKGDLIQLFKDGQFDVIVHGCNCYSMMGAGIAKQIKNEFPQAYKADMSFFIKTPENRLGKYSVAYYDGRFIINAYTQLGIKQSNMKSPVDYDAIRNVFESLMFAEFENRSIGIPAIGCGLAGGDWSIVSDILDKIEKDGRNRGNVLTFVEYEA